jgi:hypothetical protein
MNKNDIVQSYCSTLMDHNKQLLLLLNIDDQDSIKKGILALVSKNNDILSLLIKKSSPKINTTKDEIL